MKITRFGVAKVNWLYGPLSRVRPYLVSCFSVSLCWSATDLEHLPKEMSAIRQEDCGQMLTLQQNFWQSLQTFAERMPR